MKKTYEISELESIVFKVFPSYKTHFQELSGWGLIQAIEDVVVKNFMYSDVHLAPSEWIKLRDALWQVTETGSL